ncbi:Piwi domain containing protein, putative [Angomonas deanei]|uniref:Piwi domain containing protein, putative n=1 Tax=Angomonas deanei TaxID=59799 RepID=A0A7G2C502_9TRYP|nr:Piwi domain containing protein, putative [Angomonas deanei]
MDKEDNKHVKREMKITILGGRRVKVTLPELRAELNCIISQAVSLVYPTREVLRYTDSSTAKEHSSGVVTRDGVKVKVMQVKLEDGPVDVIQLDFSYGVSSALSLMNTMEEMGPNANNICGTRVVTSHAGAKDLMMVVTSTTELKASDKVGLPKDPELTFVDYFKSRYNVDLKPDGPIVKCKDPRRSTRSLPFPAEVLRSLELTPAQFNSLSDICSIYPDERRTKVLASYNRIRNSEAVTAFLDQYGIKLMGDTLLTVTGRVLPVPKIYVPNGNGFTWLDPLNPKYTRQAGFMEGVATVSHAQSRATYKVDHFLMDNFFKGTRIVEFLKKYHVAIPDPELTDFRNEHGNDKTVCMVKLENTNEDVYNRFKANFALRKTVSQMIVKEPIKVIPQMIAQQVAAKIGQMNWVVDPTEIAPKTVGSKPLVIIGLHVSLAMETVGKGRTTVKTRNLLVTCVAFLVEGKRWQPYCNHRRVQGNIVQTDEENKQVSTGTRVTPSEVANEQFDAFLREIVTVFDLKNKKEGTTLLYRTCPGEGEVVVAKGLAPMIKAALPTWEYAVLSAQVHTGTRLLWKFSASPKFVNAPRGFSSPMGIDAVYNDSVHTFILSGSFCELGNSANTCYVVLHHTAKVDKAELEKFTYALCFLYPNKADALPLPLPMKCASEYAKKFLSFQHLTELPPEMRRSMHYL